MYVWTKVWVWIPRRKRVDTISGYQVRRWIWGPMWRRPSQARPGAYVYSHHAPRQPKVESLPL